MKISIITVCLNSRNSIERTILSVASQTWTSVEHIVIDGASTDGTQDIIMHHKSKLAFYSSEPDFGIYDAMNKGICAATGDVIGILNSDDVFADVNVLARVAKEIIDGNLDAIYGDALVFSSRNRRRVVRRYSSRFFAPHTIGWGWMPAHPTLFLRRGLFDNFGLYQVSYRIAGDFELIARFFKNKTVQYKYLPDILVHMAGGGISNSGLKSFFVLNVEVLRACKENKISTNILKIISKYPLKAWEYFSR